MNPLVSVIVVSFNSSPFIIETLESILKQTWNDLELIITDDCSRDNTIEIARRWLDANSHRFRRSEVITSSVNTGVTANANRGLYASTGEWIKFLGADDTLKPKCIEENMVWIAGHTDARGLFSYVELYAGTFESENLIRTIPGDPFSEQSIMSPERDAGSQYRMLLVSDRIHYSPSVFLHRSTILSLGGFDERFKMQEDYPLWLKMTKNGYRLHFMEKVTVNYRQHVNAINNTGISYLINPNYFNSEKFRRIYTYPFMPLHLRLDQRFQYYTSLPFKNSLLNKNKTHYRFLLNILSVYLNPFRYFIWVRKKLNKNLIDNEFYA